MWVLTRGAVAAGPGEVPVSPVQAKVWGLGRVAALEHPDRWGGLVDVPPVLDEPGRRRGCARCWPGAGRTRSRSGRPGSWPGGWSGPRCRRGGAAVAAAGTVLVTGGTGAIGGHVARWLAGRGAPQVVLASRSRPGRAGRGGAGRASWPRRAPR